MNRRSESQLENNSQPSRNRRGYVNVSDYLGYNSGGGEVAPQASSAVPVSNQAMNQVYGDNLAEPMYQMPLQDNYAHEQPYRHTYENPVLPVFPMSYISTHGHDVMSPFHGFHRQGMEEGYPPQQQTMYPPSSYDSRQRGRLRTTNDLNVAQREETGSSTLFGGNSQKGFNRSPSSVTPSELGGGSASGKEKKKYRCPIPDCGKEYTVSDRLKAHMYLRHEVSSPESLEAISSSYPEIPSTPALSQRYRRFASPSNSLASFPPSRSTLNDRERGGQQGQETIQQVNTWPYIQRYVENQLSRSVKPLQESKSMQRLQIEQQEHIPQQQGPRPREHSSSNPRGNPASDTESHDSSDSQKHSKSKKRRNRRAKWRRAHQVEQQAAKARKPLPEQETGRKKKTLEAAKANESHNDETQIPSENSLEHDRSSESPLDDRSAHSPIPLVSSSKLPSRSSERNLELSVESTNNSSDQPISQSYEDGIQFKTANFDNNDVSVALPDNGSTSTIESEAFPVSNLSKASGYSTRRMSIATQELVSILQDDAVPQDLFNSAIQGEIGIERLANNLRRLLKRFAKDLKAEAAENHFHRLTAQLVAMKTRQLAQSILEGIHEVNTVHETEPYYGRSRKDGSSDEEEPVIDESIFENLRIPRKFLIESTAFKTLRFELGQFVLSPKPITKERKQQRVGRTIEPTSNSLPEDSTLAQAVKGLPSHPDPDLSGASLISAESEAPYLRASLREIVETIPRNALKISSVNDSSLVNKAKGYLEDYTRCEWDWWPLAPRVRDLQPGERRLEWILCGKILHRNISLEEANAIHEILETMPHHPPRCYCCCENDAQRITWKVLINYIARNLSSILHTQSPSSSSDGSTSSSASQRYTPVSSSSRSSSTSNIQGPSQTISSTLTGGSSNCSIQTQGQGSTCRSTGPTRVLFGVQGWRWSLELEQIQTNNLVNDSAFFRELNSRYKRHRSWIKLLLSPFRFRFCRFVKFEKFDTNRVLCRGQGLPDFPGFQHDDYDYAPRPGENPLIDRRTFALYLTACSQTCKLPLLNPWHDCFLLPRCSDKLRCIPKKKSEFDVGSTDAGIIAWGIEADHSLSIRFLAAYHLIPLLGALGFWIYWLVKYPGDWQNAAVPFLTVLALSAGFWIPFGKHFGMFEGVSIE